ncbi:DUF3826 domain-containing protein [Niabella hibiscisoli]|uniref:DUF3826 domain-containing protein n=1 Tax=Niabella hibiscisoli TaxID=1825928 RepID=UPI001F0DA972|nr:DUF3826 domain-containing protein [Niabella hibiscisoli]MCH5720210.1 DUF3826 domain-containing protein [Niabella hibiscisoli]
MLSIAMTSGQAIAQASADNQELQKKASEWVNDLKLSDEGKKQKVQTAITQHLTAVRDWHNEHPVKDNPGGINPGTGNTLSNLDWEVIYCSQKPKSVHENLMTTLNAALTPEQVEAVLDQYTIGKVAFTLKGYEAIVPDLTDKERTEILKNLKQAREQAIDYKSMKEISAIFEIYKTKCEQYLNSNGRSWKQLFKDYVNKRNAEKAAQEKNNISMKISFISFCLLLLAISSGAQKVRWKQGIVTDEFIFDTASFPSSHSATIAETPEGLIAAWFGGTKEGHKDVCIYTSHLKKGKWSKPAMAANGVLNDTLRYACYNPVLYQVPGGELILFYKIGPNVAGWTGWLKRSTDNGHTWSQREALPAGYLGPVKNKPELINGVLVCPSSTEKDGWKVHFEYTKDWGKPGLSRIPLTMVKK